MLLTHQCLFTTASQAQKAHATLVADANSTKSSNRKPSTITAADIAQIAVACPHSGNVTKGALLWAAVHGLIRHLDSSIVVLEPSHMKGYIRYSK